jgi:hypothetical protein
MRRRLTVVQNEKLTSIIGKLSRLLNEIQDEDIKWAISEATSMLVRISVLQDHKGTLHTPTKK